MTTRVSRSCVLIAVLVAGCASPATQATPPASGSALVTPTTVATRSATDPSSAPLPSASADQGASASPSASAATIVIAAATPGPALRVAWETKGAATARPSTFAPAIAPDGTVWVASGHDAAFWRFDSKGHFLGSWGTRGAGPGQFDFDHQNGGGLPDGYGGVAFGPDGTIYVLDTGNTRVERFRPDLTFIDAWGSFGSGPGQFVEPTGIASDVAGRIYVVDSRLDVQVFDPHGALIRTIGTGEAGDNPYFGAVAIGRGGHVFVNSGSDVLEYDPSGTLLRRIDLSAFVGVPLGLAVDRSGDLFVLLDDGTAPSDHPTATLELGPDDALLHVWPATGETLALDPGGAAAYVAFYQWPYLRKYALPAP